MISEGCKFSSLDEYREWAEQEDWYQSIELSCGITTHGKVSTDLREKFFSSYDFSKKRVLDIGCNSGQYCFLAKKLGANEVIGVDINLKRLAQARIINLNEDYNVTFIEKGINDLRDLGAFDIVICTAVLTEITDIIGSIEIIKTITRGVALLELDIAAHIMVLPSPFYFLKKRRFPEGYANLRKSKHGYMISPSMSFLRTIFGNQFIIIDKGPCVRYQMVEVRRKELQ